MPASVQTSVRVCVCVCVCVRACVRPCVRACVHPPLRLLITSGVIWTPYDWLNKIYSFYMAAVVIIDDGRGLTVEVCHINQPNKSKLSLYKPLLPL